MHTFPLRAALGATALVLGLATHAATHDVAADWSTTANPNGAWSYRSGDTLLPAQPTTGVGLPDVPSFAPSNSPGAFLPIFWQKDPGTFLVHSVDPANGGLATGEAVLVWTSPVTGTADVSGFFFYEHEGFSRSNDVTVRLRGTVLGSAVVSFSEHADSAHPWTFSFNDLEVSAGDRLTVSFVRSPGMGLGTIARGDVTVITTPVPEPATALTILVGGLGLAAWRRLRR